MANVRCPMCSKINPPEVEVCSYCGARLKPVRPPSATPPASSPSTPKQSEPDWLRGLSGVSSQPEEGASGKAPEKPTGITPGPSAGKPSSEPAPGKRADSTPPSPTESGDSGASDWLSRIRERSNTDTGTPQGSGTDESAQTPDWLKGIDEESSSLSSDEGFDLGMDWMNRLQNPLETTSEPTVPTQPENVSPFGDFDLSGGTEQPDWMRNLSDETPSGESGMDWAMEGDAAPISSSSTSESDQEDWMKNLPTWDSEPSVGERQETEWKPDLTAPQTPAEPAASSGLDDLSWLDSLKPDSATPSPTDINKGQKDLGQIPSGTGLTGFLASLNEPETGQEFSPEVQNWEPNSSEKAPLEPFPGWPAEEPSTPAQVEPRAGAEGDISSWLRSFDSDAPSEPVGPTELNAPARPEEPTSEIPDWLNSTPAEPQGASKAEPGEAADGLPSWLSGGFGAAEPSSTKTPAQPESETDLPTWLSGMEETSTESQPETPSAEPGVEPAGLPSWLSGDDGLGQSSAGEPSLQAAEPNEAGAPFEALPDWLSETEKHSTGGQPAFEMPAAEGDLWSASQSTVPQESDAMEPAVDELPAASDLLSGFEQVGTAEETPSKLAGTPDQAYAFDSGETPDWMREFNAQPSAGAPVSPVDQQGAGTPTGQESSSPFAVELPDWLGEEAQAQPAEASEHPGQPTSDNLAQADLPDWVMKMRPLESAMMSETASAEADQRVEKAGPLAGMRGVLPAEEMVTRYRKPPIYSAKLRTTEKQRSQSTLLDSILAQETQPLLIPSERSQAPRVILQIVLAVVLIAGVLFGLLGGFVLTPTQPPLAPVELQNMFYDLDKTLQPNQSVLLAVDYEPGYSGEMRLAAAAVVDQLMTKNARIVIVSTVPTGPALADALLREAAQSHPTYPFGDKNQVIYLGYLPGGTISLVEFAGYPRLAAPVTANPEVSPWNGALKDINTIADFSQVIVLTDTPETGRAWVEQVGPSLKNVPLYMVASAQAAPMLLPYWESGQIKGMVSGLVGGALYSWPQEQANQAQGVSPVRRYYTAYQIGILLGMVVIVVGAITSAGIALVKRGSKDEA